jgi:hypothetical protein
VSCFFMYHFSATSFDKMDVEATAQVSAVLRRHENGHDLSNQAPLGPENFPNQGWSTFFDTRTHNMLGLHAVAKLVVALCYKPEGRGIDSL